jgi:hypothetical protein
MHSFPPQLICANTTSAPLICSSHGYHIQHQRQSLNMVRTKLTAYDCVYDKWNISVVICDTDIPERLSKVMMVTFVSSIFAL